MDKTSNPPINLSHTMMASYRRCRYQFYLSYIENYAPLPTIGLFRGSAGHKALAAYYGHGVEPEKAIQIALEVYKGEMDGSNDQMLMDDFVVLEGCLQRYFEFAKANDNFESVQAVEHEFKIGLGGGLILKGFIDGIVTTGGQTWLLEHKFLKRVETKSLDLDPQISIYMLASYLLGYQPTGVFYNIVRVGDSGVALKEPVMRIPQYRNPEGLEAIYKEIIEQGKEMKNFMENGGNIYRNQTMNCSWDCPFYDVCLSINDVGSGEAILERIPRKPGKRIYLEE